MSKSEAALKIDETITLVARWLNQTQQTETKSERRQSDQLAALISVPNGVAFTIYFVDRVALHRDDKAAANQLFRLSKEKNLPKFLNTVDRLMLSIGARLAPFLP